MLNNVTAFETVYAISFGICDSSVNALEYKISPNIIDVLLSKSEFIEGLPLLVSASSITRV